MNLLDILSAPWAIRPEKLVEIRDVYLAHVRGEQRDFEAKLVAQAGDVEQLPPPRYEVTGAGVAVIAIEGIIGKRFNMLQRFSGGTSSQLVERDLRAAMADPTVRAILLEIDSPGGQVEGTQELAQLVHEASAEKPIATWTNGSLGSAAYWIGSAASQIFISGECVQTGSIGVVATHVDVSKAEEARGIKTTEIIAGRYKRIASQHAPLSAEGRQALQDQVDYLYQIFVGEVAQNRGRSPETVHAEMADGRVFIGRQAIAVGLADGIGSQQTVIAELASGRIARRVTRSG